MCIPYALIDRGYRLRTRSQQPVRRSRERALLTLPATINTRPSSARPDHFDHGRFVCSPFVVSVFETAAISGNRQVSRQQRSSFCGRLSTRALPQPVVSYETNVGPCRRVLCSKRCAQSVPLPDQSVLRSWIQAVCAKERQESIIISRNTGSVRRKSEQPCRVSSRI